VRRSAPALLAFALALVCAGASATPSAAQGEPAASPPASERHVVASHPRPRARTRLVRTNVPNAVPDPGFESGGFAYWQQCGSVNASVTAARAHAGKYAQ
jgi:hypothetical protein